MLTITEMAAENLGSHLTEHMGRGFGSTDARLVELVGSAARLAMEYIGNSDALYHDIEHTMLVTLVGYDILRGRRLLTETNASDFAHLIFACLFHDIGYVRGIVKGDNADGYIVDAKGNTATLRRGSSDAASNAVSRRPVKAVSLWIAWPRPNCSMPPASPMPSSSRVSRHLLAPMRATAKKACCYA